MDALCEYIHRVVDDFINYYECEREHCESCKAFKDRVDNLLPSPALYNVTLKNEFLMKYISDDYQAYMSSKEYSIDKVDIFIHNHVMKYVKISLLKNTEDPVVVNILDTIRKSQEVRNEDEFREAQNAVNEGFTKFSNSKFPNSVTVSDMDLVHSVINEIWGIYNVIHYIGFEELVKIILIKGRS